MSTYITKKFMILIFSFILGMLISVDWSPKQGVTVGFHSVYATVGHPLSAGSAAGVHRRHERRHGG